MSLSSESEEATDWAVSVFVVNEPKLVGDGRDDCWDFRDMDEGTLANERYRIACKGRLSVTKSVALEVATPKWRLDYCSSEIHSMHHIGNSSPIKPESSSRQQRRYVD